MEELSREFSVSKPKMYQLLQAMSDVDLIRVIRHERDFSAYSKGAKIFLKDFSVYFAMNGNKGSGREAFVSYSLSMIGEVFACKDERICDFIVNGIKIEVGGKGKIRKGATSLSPLTQNPHKEQNSCLGLSNGMVIIRFTI